jgi:hypothetical protein
VRAFAYTSARMRRWLWAALGTAASTLTLASACDKPEAPAPPLDPAATATASAERDAGQVRGSASPPVDAGLPTAPSDADPSPAEAPLAHWMKEHAAPAILHGDIYALAEAFDTIATFAPKVPPPAYANWVSIAKDGAAAARAASLEGAKGACRGCHSQYRNAYKAEMRARPLP